MGTIGTLQARKSPRITFSALVDVLTHPVPRLMSVLKAQKYPQAGPVFSHKKARERLIDWATGGPQPNPQDPSLRDQEADVLFEAVTAFATAQAMLPAGATMASKPSPEPCWFVNGVEVSVFPDLLVSGLVRGQPATGAVKFFLRKDPTPVGSTLAALLYYHRHQVVQDPTVDPSLCAVVDVQAGAVYAATGNYQRLVTQVQNTCTVIAGVWPAV